MTTSTPIPPKEGGKEVSDPGEDSADLEVPWPAGLPKQPKEAGANSNTNGQTAAQVMKDIDIKDGKYRQGDYTVDGLFMTRTAC